ncbi:DUF4190 domain-containing protein [Aeromicrobium massiliense]|uniref:DUF4190 domain-containing protein n=1 Tax=Aeromicrobium massiliense TaxID=1464554 RepID=UPI0003198201|nr:DUF4190 domain-containing protein [Aeromicrobium massiliense]
MTDHDPGPDDPHDLPPYGWVPPDEPPSVPPPGGPGWPPPAWGPPPPEQNKKALWSMILGILGLVCCCFLLGVPAIVLGILARQEIDASGGRQDGGGMALAGLVLGAVSLVGTAVSWAFNWLDLVLAF